MLCKSLASSNFRLKIIIQNNFKNPLYFSYSHKIPNTIGVSFSAIVFTHNPLPISSWLLRHFGSYLVAMLSGRGCFWAWLKTLKHGGRESWSVVAASRRLLQFREWGRRGRGGQKKVSYRRVVLCPVSSSIGLYPVELQIISGLFHTLGAPPITD